MKLSCKFVLTKTLNHITMEATHNINYEGLELEVKGEFEQDEPEVGFKGGWSYWTIEANGIDISWMLKDDIINKINEIIVTENY